MSSGWSFRPPLWAVFGLVVGCSLTTWLGIWQLRRGHEKAALMAQYAQAQQQAPVDLHADSRPPGRLRAQLARARGQYLGERQLLLDNQVRKEVPGYHVWTPLRLDGGGVVVVDRCWIARSADGRQLPAVSVPQGEVEVRGLWRALPQPALRLSVDNCPVDAHFPHLVEYPTAEDLSCLVGSPVAPGELLLDPAAADGYVREWSEITPGMPPERHYAYAAQWFAFCATLLVLFVTLNLRRLP